MQINWKSPIIHILHSNIISYFVYRKCLEKLDFLLTKFFKKNILKPFMGNKFHSGVQNSENVVGILVSGVSGLKEDLNLSEVFALLQQWDRIVLTSELKLFLSKLIIWPSPTPHLFSISSYSLIYSGIVDFLKFASQANSKHFFMGQKKSALTSFKFSNEATI